MTAKIHRILTNVGGFLSAVGVLLASAEYDILGIDPKVDVAIGLVGAVITVGATFVRSATEE